MKKVAKLSIMVLLMMVVFTAKVYAKPSCTISMHTTQEEVEQGKEITIEVKLANIQSERGIIAMEGMLEYEKDCLTLSKMEGQNAWNTPIKNLSYNESSGKFVIDKEGLAKSDETILKITFIANTTKKENTTISLNNMIVADGTAPAKLGNTYKNITIKDKEEKPTPGEEEKPNTKPTPDEEQKPNTKPTPGEVQKPSTKPTPGEEQKTNGDQKTETKPTENEEQETNTILNQEQEENLIEEDKNTNQTIEKTENKTNLQTEKNNNVIIFVFVLVGIILIIGVILYVRRKNRKKRRR